MEDEDAITVASAVGVGSEFTYIFDLGDDWTHACRVLSDDVNAENEYGGVPEEIVPVWGWGSIPDQYGRESADEEE